MRELNKFDLTEDLERQPDSAWAISYWVLPGGYDVLGARVEWLFYSEANKHLAEAFAAKWEAPPTMAILLSITQYDHYQRLLKVIVKDVNTALNKAIGFNPEKTSEEEQTASRAGTGEKEHFTAQAGDAGTYRVGNGPTLLERINVRKREWDSFREREVQPRRQWIPLYADR